MNVFTGNFFRLIPTTNQLSFVFQNIYSNSTGTFSLGFSGTSGEFNFTFNNGVLYSPQNKDILKYNVGQQINISGIYNTGLYSYYLNNSLIENNSITNNITFSNFFVNVTGTNLICDNIQLSTNPITIQIIPNPTFLSASGLNGIIQNTSNSNVRIYNSNLYFSYSDTPLLTGFITGNLSGNSNLNFFLWDSDENPTYYNLPVQFLITLDTNIGILNGYYTTIKSSGLYNTVNTLSTNDQNINIPVLFFGSGLQNQFIYNPPNNASALFNYSAFSRDFSGNRLSQVITFSLNPISPLNSGYYTSQYVTGIQIINSGQYLFCPEVIFTGYYYITGLNYNQYSTLLSSGCTGNIPVSFVSIDGYGTGASGYLSLLPVLFSGVYNTGLAQYNIINSFNILSGGTGYTQPPLAKINTGIYNHCFDVPLASGFNYSIFLPFNTVGGIQPLAAYFTGETICVTGIVGSNQTGYLVSGILIDNPGSGFNNSFFPKFSFIRTGSDNLTQNASGIALIKESGLYIFNNNWSVLTGNTFGLFPYSGSGLYPSGYFILGQYQEDFAIQILFSGNDYTQPIVVQLNVCNTTGECLTSLISGTQTYDSYQYFLKKKILGLLVNTQPGNTFNFLTSQDLLDSIYNSSVYSSQNQILIGNLDF